jgi:hypothetical protein
MGYDIYDLQTRNLLDSFRTEQEALEAVQLAIKEDGPDSVQSWALGPSDRSAKAVSGSELIARAEHRMYA